MSSGVDLFSNKNNIPKYAVVLIGAGPCGLSAALEFKNASLNYLHLESGNIAQTIYNFTSNIRLYSCRKDLEIGNIRFQGNPAESPTREEYLEYLKSVSVQLKLDINRFTKAESIVKYNNEYMICYIDKNGNSNKVVSRNIVIASGGYYAPKLLGIPGEDEPYVSHFFRSELEFKNKIVFVVGGGNSAIDAINILIAKEATPILSYRGSRILKSKIKPWTLDKFENNRKKGLIKIFFNSIPKSIKDNNVELILNDNEKLFIPVDMVFLLTGYGPDYTIIRNASIPFHKRNKRPLFNPKTLETKIPGIFLCGTVVLKWKGNKASIENTLKHGEIIIKNLR